MAPIELVTVVGARPQFVKAAAVRRAIDALAGDGGDAPLVERLVHTGQHYDPALSDVFFEELDIPRPDVHLEVGSGTHGAQTGRMLERLERVLQERRPAAVLLYGDTNSTLAGALAAAKLQLPIAHVEAGLRSYDRSMPEEQNRVVTDHLATWLYCPTQLAARQLAAEGIESGVEVVGDAMLDVFREAADRLPVEPALAALGLERGQYALATLHRAENTDDPARLRALLDALRRVADALPVVLPLHPRTEAALARAGLSLAPLRALPPAPYEQMICLERGARVILTDSGGVQKEAYWAGVPCVTLRETTEWPETIEAGWNALATDLDRLPQLALRAPPADQPDLYGDGRAAERLVHHLLEALRGRG